MCTISIRLMNIENNMELLDKIVWKLQIPAHLTTHSTKS